MPYYANGLEAHIGDRVKLHETYAEALPDTPEVVIVDWADPQGDMFFGRDDRGDTWRWRTAACTRVAKGRSHPTLATPDRLDG